RCSARSRRREREFGHRSVSEERVYNTSVIALLASVLLSSSAALAQATALGKQVYDMTGRELDLGLLGLAEFAPAALLVLVTGSVADRFDRRRVAALSMLGEACVSGALAWNAGTRSAEHTSELQSLRQR